VDEATASQNYLINYMYLKKGARFMFMLLRNRMQPNQETKYSNKCSEIKETAYMRQQPDLHVQSV
jgi:hypothetical protein